MKIIIEQTDLQQAVSGFLAENYNILVDASQIQIDGVKDITVNLSSANEVATPRKAPSRAKPKVDSKLAQSPVSPEVVETVQDTQADTSDPTQDLVDDADDSLEEVAEVVEASITKTTVADVLKQPTVNPVLPASPESALSKAKSIFA